MSRPDLKLYDPDNGLRIRCVPAGATKTEPYFAIYVVSYVHGNPAEIWEAEKIAHFRHSGAEEALDTAERLVRDLDRLATAHTVKNAAAIIVNDHEGKRWGTFPILRVVPASGKRPWWVRMLRWW